MSHFPLYTTLSSSLPDRDLTVVQKNSLIKNIEKLDQDAHELIFALIKCYYNENENGNNLDIPYNGELKKGLINFDLLKLPNKLRQLLHNFVTLHTKRMAEDKKIKEIHETVNE